MVAYVRARLARFQRRRTPRGALPDAIPAVRKRRLRRAAAALLLIVVIISQLNGPFGAWTADRLRAILGPAATAQIESWYLGVSDALTQAKYHLPGQTVAPPYSVTATPVGPAKTLPPATPTGMALTTIPPLLRPALPGEGVWTVVATRTTAPDSPALVAKTYYRPDPQRPYAITVLLKFDPHGTTLHLVAGKMEPGGQLGNYGSGVIPAADQQGQQLLAALNGGFKYADGQYGMMANGVVYVPPRHGQATIAITTRGTIFIGAWGIDPRLSLANHHLVAWRQNAALLIDHGVLNPLTSDGGAWGGTILNSTYTWRSGLGITADGALIYAGGNALSAATLGKSLLAAGAVMAMQTDINPYWVRAFTYQRDSTGALRATKLDRGMQGKGDEYFQGDARDFFYVTRAPLSKRP